MNQLTNYVLKPSNCPYIEGIVIFSSPLFIFEYEIPERDSYNCSHRRSLSQVLQSGTSKELAKRIDHARAYFWESAKEGSRTKMVYNLNGQKMELLQTIEKIVSPNEFSVIFGSEGMDNFQNNLFSENQRGDTIWVSKNEFIPLNFKMRLFMALFPSTFKKQSRQYMKNFKKYMEQNISVNSQ